jgi:hypothetical protein
MSRKAPRKPGNYEVGYGKPPEHSRFRPGESGNRRGRPKGSRNLRTYFEEALAEQVVVNEGGRRRKISKGKVAFTQLVNRAAKGDIRAIRTVFEMVRWWPEAETPTPADPSAQESRSNPEPSKLNLDKLTTKELETLFEAALIMEGTRERPPPPVPPGGPEESEEDT